MINNVIVKWKYLTESKENNTTSITCSNPKLIFDKEDIKGKSKWDDGRWLMYAVNWHKRTYNIDYEIKEFEVLRVKD